jgi:putative nucleotidyltransferase with HDIG domain
MLGLWLLMGHRLPWICAIVTAAVLMSISLLSDLLHPLKLPAKGSVAPYTVRAAADAVFDLHETVAAEAQEAKQAYLPIYNKDNSLLFEYRRQILTAALEQPLSYWKWSAEPPPQAQDGGLEPWDGEASVPPEEEKQAEMALPPASDAGAVPEAKATVTEEDPLVLEEARRRELEALIKGFFGLLIPYYKAGVVEDSEFPKEKKTIRVFSQKRIVLQDVAELYRFSELHEALKKSAEQYFYKTDQALREQAIHFILQLLPPNLTYAKENKGFITDISQVTGVKVILIRQGNILVRRGQTIDPRAYYALRANVQAAADSSPQGRAFSRGGLLVALMLLFVYFIKRTSEAQFRRNRSYGLVFWGLILTTLLAEVLLFYLPLHHLMLPQAALALIVAVAVGRIPGLIIGILTPMSLILTQMFDLATLMVGGAGGMMAALTIKRGERFSALAAGIWVGVAQTLVFAACQFLEGRPQTSEELNAAAVAFGSGLGSGLLALMSLPYVQWFLEKSSRGKLKVLTDYDHPLVRELHKRAPGTFTHTIHLMTLVERGVDAVGGDGGSVLLARAGTLYHDIGKMNYPHLFLENRVQARRSQPSLDPSAMAQAFIDHVRAGLEIALQRGLPPDVIAFIAEHHGTMPLGVSKLGASIAEGEPEEKILRYPGPKPQSLETAVLMVANALEHAAQKMDDPPPEAWRQLVERVVLEHFSEQQFSDCGMTLHQLERMKAAFINYFEELHQRQTEAAEAEEKGPP